MDKLESTLAKRGYELIKSSEFTQIYHFKDKFLKVYLGKTAEQRFRRERNFYEKYSSRHSPTFIDTEVILSHPALETKFLPEHGLAFLSDEEAGRLEVMDFEHIFEALTSLQTNESEGILVNGDLAPHNIYLNGRNVIISDWDSYNVEQDARYTAFDFATLWYWLYENEEHLCRIYKQGVMQYLHYEGQFANFKSCYLEIVVLAQQRQERHLKRGKKLREVILDSFS